jgi:hypothetical protein
MTTSGGGWSAQKIGGGAAVGTSLTGGADASNQIERLKAQIETLSRERDELKAALDREMIGSNFARSKYVSERLTLPPDAAAAYLGKYFEVRDGKLVAFDANGAQIFSPTRFTEPASFDEAIERIVAAHPHKAAIMKGSGRSPVRAEGTTLSRAEFDRLDPASKMARVRDGVKLVDG